MKQRYIFKVVIAFSDGAFKSIINWIRQELHVDLTTCAADLHVLRAKNIIKFVKERVRCIQSETPFIKYLKRLTIKIMKLVTILINLFNRKSGVHLVISARHILFEKSSRLHCIRLAS